MCIEEYIRDGETVYCEAETQMHGAESDGSLAVTDTRLIYHQSLYFSDTRIHDIDVSRIDAIEYQKSPIRYLYLLIAGILSFVILVFWFLSPILHSFFENLFIRGAISLFVLFYVGLLVAAALQQKQVLKVHTASDSYKFAGGKLGDFPHAIRGNG